MDALMYHNPRCSKSRQTLALLDQRGIQPTIIDYLNQPPSVEQLQAVLKMLGMAPRDLMRTKEEAYKAQQLDDSALTNEQLLQAMIRTPVLIERPIVVIDGRAAIGRPPETVLSLLPSS